MNLSVIGRIGASFKKAVGTLSPVDSRGGGWWPVVKESFGGAWQKNVEWTVDTVLANHAIYACVTRISNSIGNLPIRLMRVDDNGIWTETNSAAFSPVLRKPNRYQNHIQFVQWWIISKLVRGNMYGLKQRDNRGLVTAIYILDPCKAQVLVSPDGSVFYRFGQDNLNGIIDIDFTVPASEIIHDRMNCLFHPLVGIAPLFACGLAADQGLKIQSDSSIFFANGANPGGVLTAPGAISDETAKRLQEKWTANYTGENAGKVAVMGDGLKFEPMRMSYADAQLIEQLRMTAEIVCSTFGMPSFKIGMGSIPTGMKVGDLNQMYYEDALHTLIEEMELCLDEGLALPTGYRTELDLDNLLRMDEASMVATLAAGVQGSVFTINHAQKKLGLPSLDGGDTIYMQQQDFPLREVKNNKLPGPDPIAALEPEAALEVVAEDEARELIEYIRKALPHAA